MIKRPRFRFSSKIVVASVSAVIFYTVFIFYLEILNIENGTNIQLPADLTAAWYAFWTIELVCLASIRKTKIKNKFEYEVKPEDADISKLKQEVEDLKSQLNDNGLSQKVTELENKLNDNSDIDDLNQKVVDLESKLNSTTIDQRVPRLDNSDIVNDNDDGLIMLNE